MKNDDKYKRYMLFCSPVYEESSSSFECVGDYDCYDNAINEFNKKIETRGYCHYTLFDRELGIKKAFGYDVGIKRRGAHVVN